MPRVARLLLITFLESFSTLVVERGIYFYTETQLHFSDAANLWLALGFGVAYVAGALVSHRITGRFGEKSMLLAAMAAQFAVHVVMSAWPTPVMMFLANTSLGWLYGVKWPIVESYVNAGLTPEETAKAVGRFNVSWALAAPVALGVTGPAIRMMQSGLFCLPAGVNVICAALSLPLEPRPVHLPDDHPQRPDARGLRRLRGLLAASRWMLLASYALLWVLAALLPGVFRRLSCPVQLATGLSSVLDVARVTAFVAMQFWTGWHGRVSALAVAMVPLPAGFFLALFGPNLPAAGLGEVLFGLSAGVIYYNALYYAMVVKNAAVDAGGTHEGLIGTGFAIGPAAGLVGLALASSLGGRLPGTIAGIGLPFLVCTVGACLALRRQVAGTPPGRSG